MLFTEGGHFTIVPNALKIIYGEAAGPIYGVIFTFTGVSNLMMLFIVKSSFGQSYTQVFHLSAGLSLAALVLLVLCFQERQVMAKEDQSDLRYNKVAKEVATNRIRLLEEVKA